MKKLDEVVRKRGVCRVIMLTTVLIRGVYFVLGLACHTGRCYGIIDSLTPGS